MIFGQINWFEWGQFFHFSILSALNGYFYFILICLKKEKKVEKILVSNFFVHVVVQISPLCRGFKLKLSRRPHETESKVWLATLKKEFFFRENRQICPIFPLKSSFFLMFASRIGPSRGPRVWDHCVRDIYLGLRLDLFIHLQTKLW